jgi:septum formation topological specificity factor MinE
MFDKFEKKQILQNYVLDNSHKIMEVIAKELNIKADDLYFAFSNDIEIQQNILKIIERHMDNALNKELN